MIKMEIPHKNKNYPQVFYESRFMDTSQIIVISVTYFPLQVRKLLLFRLYNKDM